MAGSNLLALCASAILVTAAGCAQGETPGGKSPAEATTPESATEQMPSDPYLAEITKFRQDRQATLKGDAGWLTIAGLWFLTQPQTTFGSDPLNDIVFPASAP